MRAILQNTILLATLVSVLGLYGCSTSGSSAVGAYAAPNVSLKNCSGYGCIYTGQFSVSLKERAKLQKIMAGQTTAADERRAIGVAIQKMEQIAKAKLRYQSDIGKAFQVNAGKRGQMDCVDESLNTTEYLFYLQGQGLLRFHKTRKHYAERGLLINGAYPHKSAVVVENNGSAWTIDSWPNDHAGAPQIMKLSVWRRKKNTDS